MPRLLLLLLAALIVLAGCEGAQQAAVPGDAAAPLTVDARVPDWAADAVFYQIFPERFRNGDPSNDPTRASLETPVSPRVPASWTVSGWTADWYERQPWETERGDDFYEDGVFDRRYGGDLQGVIDRLDYLRNLGINTIYFNPVFWARSMHKYDGNTFHHIDPHFGPDPEGDFALMAEETSDPATWNMTAADRLFFDLVEAAHARGLRVVIDGVWNHTGRDFFAFDDIRRRGADSPYADWYIVNAFDDPATSESEFDYEGWWGVDTLPLFADTPDGTDLHPGPKQYVFDATARWMDPNGDGDPSDGIDGWRLDVANEVPVRFWADWNAHVRDLNPEAYTVSEIWHDAADFLEEGGFSATMNYHGFAFPVKAYLIDRGAEPSAFGEMLNERRADYAGVTQHVLQNLIDSHDTDRLASMIVNRDPADARAEQAGFDRDVSPRNNRGYVVRAPNAAERASQRLVALFQMTYVGAPMIYYGTEAGMWGADDPDDRMPMVWRDLTYDAQTRDPLGRTRPADAVGFDEDVYDYYRRAIALRRDHEVLRRGDFDVLHADDETGTFTFLRTHGGARAAVALNPTDEAHSLRVPLPEDARGTYELAFTTHDEGYRVQQDAEALLLEIPARGGLVLVRQ